MDENAVKADIWDYLLDIGAMVVRVNSGRRGKLTFAWWQVKGIKRQTSGIFDIPLVLYQRRLFSIETKRPGELPSPEQLCFADEVRKHGGIPIIADSVNDVRRAIEEAVWPSQP